MTRRIRAFAAYLALFALALQAAWPLLAHAAPARTALVPVCTVDGVTHFTEVPIRAVAADDSAAAHADHCAFCPLGCDRPVATTASAAEEIEESSFFPLKAEQSLSDLSDICLQARPRAPPFLPLAMDIDQLRRNHEQESTVGRLRMGAPGL